MEGTRSSFCLFFAPDFEGKQSCRGDTRVFLVLCWKSDFLNCKNHGIAGKWKKQNFKKKSPPKPKEEKKEEKK